MYSSLRGSPKAISAVLLTFPETTHLPIKFIISTIAVTERGFPMSGSRTFVTDI